MTLAHCISAHASENIMVPVASGDDSGLEGTSFFISLVVLSRVWGHVYVCARVPAVGGMCGCMLFFKL